MKELTNERIKDMRARIVMIIMAVALIALPTMAQDWQSTSTMQGSGSAYSAQVTAVGAAEATDMATTTESYTPANGAHRARRDFIDPNNPGHQSEEFPIGDAVLPLLLLACAYLIIRVMRRKEV